MLVDNAAFHHFTGVSYFPRLFAPLPIAALMCLWIAANMRGRARAAGIIADLSLYALAMVVMAALTTGAQYTPHAPIDAALARWDASLGWDGPAVLHWVAQRPALRRFLDVCYMSTDLQLALAPLAAALAPDRRRSRVLVHAMIYSLLAGTLIYWFFPSSGPAGAYGSADFAPLQRLTSQKFAWVHSFQPGATIAGGMIAFPSFHVAWSVLVVDAARASRRLFWPALALNCVVVASTVLLGWHFLVDAPAGILLAVAAIAAGEQAHARLSGRA
jgi:hypothetical protein